MVDEMTAWEVFHPGPLSSHPLRRVTRPVPDPAPGEVLVRVQACGVCRTDLHLCEGDLAPRRPRTVPGHQVVGDVVSRGVGADRFRVGQLVGVAWLRSTCGACEWCRSGAENLCPQSRYTGWDADGGLAEYTTVPEAYAYDLSDTEAPELVAPLLCAGIIGYRALRRAQLPPGGRLGIYGFGSSAHITAQVAALQGAEIYVMTRGAQNQQLAREIGAVHVGATSDAPPVPLDAAIIFAPAGELVPVALVAVRPGGTVVLAGIYVSDIPQLMYDRHLFYERDLRSVTSNTRRDGEELLRLAANLPLRLTVRTRAMAQADQALADVLEERVSGSTVVLAGPPPGRSC
jgi:propanol-preferring alcohol dehydrogenase